MDEIKELQSLTTPKGAYNSFPDKTAREQLGGKLNNPGSLKSGDYLRVQSIGADGTVVLEGTEGTGGGAGQNAGFDPTAYGLPVLDLTGDISPVRVSKDNKVTMAYVYGERSGSCTMKGQGSSSYKEAQALGDKGKFNYTIVFDEAFEAAPGWGAQTKYCLKANFIDPSQARNVVCAKLWGRIRKTRTNLDPRLQALPNAGAVDGFPVAIMLNGKFHGLYTWNIPKDGWMFGMMEGSGDTQAIVCANDHCPDTQFKGETALDGDGFELEFASGGTDWIAPSLNQLINACIESWGGHLDTTIGPYLDWGSAVDYYIFTVLIDGRDMTDKNYLLATYDGIKWLFGAYDMDSVFGLKWDGKSVFRPDDTKGDAVTFEAFAAKHRLFELIKRFKTNELKARYTELRKSVLSECAIAELFENWAWAIPAPIKIEDVRLYPSIPGSDANTVDQILRWLHHRLEIVDGWIDALPEQETPVNPNGYTNWVPLSIDKDGSIYNGTGYKNGCRVNVETGEEDTSYRYFAASGFIPIIPGDVVEVHDVDWLASQSNNVVGYDANFEYIGGASSKGTGFGQSIINGDFVRLNDNDVRFTTTAWRDNLAYIRVSATRTDTPQDGANMIVTINEEIA